MWSSFRTLDKESSHLIWLYFAQCLFLLEFQYTHYFQYDAFSAFGTWIPFCTHHLDRDTCCSSNQCIAWTVSKEWKQKLPCLFTCWCIVVCCYLNQVEFWTKMNQVSLKNQKKWKSFLCLVSLCSTQKKDVYSSIHWNITKQKLHLTDIWLEFENFKLIFSLI